jgi:inner membrane transporter RhtA
MNITLEKASPTRLVILSVVCVQVGAALSKSLFGELGPWGVVLLRIGFSALILSVITRPKWNRLIRHNFKLLMAFGIIFTLMNAFLFLAIDRIPLGIAISVQFTGPLGLAAIKSQRWLDGLWVSIAGFGILLLTPLSGASVDAWGITLALLAGVCWALYIVLAAEVGQKISGMEGLTWALIISTVLLLPMGVAAAGSALLNPRLLTLGAAIAVLSTTLPYSFEMVALRSIPVKIFGVLLSIEPMVSAIAGLLILGEKLSIRSIIACLLVSTAAAGAAKCRIPRIESALPKQP